MAKTSNFLACPVSKAYDLDALQQVKQYRRVGASDLRPIVAIDTETDKGDIFLLADSDGNYLDNQDISLDNVISFLFRHQYKWIFCWNLSYDGDVISKLLGQHLYKYLQTGRLSFDIKDAQGRPYNIRYIENKALTIKKEHHSVTVYDIAQFYDRMRLDEAYTKIIKLPLPADYVAMKSERDHFTRRYYRDNKKKVRNYCIQDCLFTKALSEHWVKTFHETYSFYPARWLSSGYLAEKVLIANNVVVPYFHEIKYPIQKLARACFYGGRFEMLYKGFIGNGYEYDINAAYPYALTTIPDLHDGHWIESNEIKEDARLGFFHIRAQVHSSVRVAPFPFRQKNNRIFFPFGQFETFVTLPELLAVNALNTEKIGYKILQGYQFVPSCGKDVCKYIFKDFIIDQYQKRQLLKAQGSPLERTIKVILNSIYGKTAQKTRVSRFKTVMGNLHCPVIASHITGFTRAQLLTVTHAHNMESDVAAYATDSITVRRPISNLTGDSLGGMKLAKQANDMFMIQNGMVRTNGNWKVRGMGFDREKNIPIEHVKTTETGDGRVVITLQRKRPQRLKSAIIRGRIVDIGKFQTYTKEINLNADTKRFWLGRLQSAHDERCFNSVPLDVNLGGYSYASEPAPGSDNQSFDYDPYGEDIAGDMHKAIIQPAYV
jgi:hypothetical protein